MEPSDQGNNGLDPVVREAQERFERVSKWESNARKLWLDDYKFANADADNGYQWPNDIRRNRDVDEKPCLTINKVRQHNLQIINDAFQHKPGIKTLATGGDASGDAAQIWNGIFRRIEYLSDAQQIYDIATKFQVEAGIGYWRVVTEYTDDASFDQEVYIRLVNDPLTVYIDPDAKAPDKSDMRYAFVFDDIPQDQFDKMYPKYKGKGGQAALGAEIGWVTGDTVRVCEYYRCVEKKNKLYALTNEAGDRRVVTESKIPKAMLKEVIDNPQTRWREIVETEVEWHLIIGNEKVETKKWAGKYIPIVAVIGEEVIVDGLLDRKGHTRALKDPQRMYNYWSSAAVEYGALQSKTPYIAAAEAIEGYETYWNTANRVNHSILPYNGLNDAGEPIAPPQRQEPPVAAPVCITGMQVAASEMMMVSGQYQAQMGEQGNERSGKAIQERQRQGDNATYHYINNLAIAIRFTGKILLDLVPKIYDTKRVMRIMAEDGADYEITVDPAQKQALVVHQMQDAQNVQRMFNPAVGRYDVMADVGPAYATRREEAFNAFSLILTQAPELTGLIGDILFKAGDFPMAEEAAKRLKNMVPPQALGTGPSQQEQAMMQQITQLKGLLSKTMEELAGERLKLKGKDQLRDIDAYQAETDRWKAVIAATPEEAPGLLKQIIRQLVQETLATSLGPVLAASAPGLATAASYGGAAQAAQMTLPFERQLPVPGARRGPNGQWYDPQPQNSQRYAPEG